MPHVRLAQPVVGVLREFSGVGLTAKGKVGQPGTDPCLRFRGGDPPLGEEGVGGGQPPPVAVAGRLLPIPLRSSWRLDIE